MPVFGCFTDSGDPLALAGYKTWGEETHIAIVSAPSHRGRGFSTAAVACAAQHAIGAGPIPQYRTLASNAASMGIAKNLGFERYGFSVFIRLAAD